MRQGRTDAWIAHQLDVSVGDIRSFKRDHELAPTTPATPTVSAGGEVDEPDLRAEDDALVAAALEAEAEADDEDDEPEDEIEPRRRRRRRGRTATSRASAGAGGAAAAAGASGRGALEGTFDHGDEGYGLWLDPAVQDDPVYAEHWAGHRPVTVVGRARADRDHPLGRRRRRLDGVAAHRPSRAASQAPSGPGVRLAGAAAGEVGRLARVAAERGVHHGRRVRARAAWRPASPVAQSVSAA